MPAQLTEIRAVFLAEKWRRDNFFIGQARLAGGGGASAGNGDLDLSKAFGVLGESDPDELVQQLEYNLYGRWEENQKYGRQFRIHTFRKVEPHGQAGVIRYLQQAPHVGLSVASTLWEKFGGDAVRMLRESPDSAAAAVGGGFNCERASRASEYLWTQQSLENCSIELIDLLGKRGFPKTIIRKAIKVWGNRAAGMIRKNPYLLMAFPRCGFLRCDALYLDLGHSPKRLKRQALAGWHAISTNSDGHTWFPVKFFEQGVLSRVGGADANPPKALSLAVRAARLASHRDDAGALWVAEWEKASDEDCVAFVLDDAIQNERPCRWPPPESVQGISDHQREQLLAILAEPKSRIALLTGSPGTGKTYVAAALVRAIIARHGCDSVAVAAPTGKAAVRVSEAMQQYGISIRARTIHSLLKVEEQNLGGWKFKHHAGNPLPFRFVLIDESSMCDTWLTASLLEAVPLSGRQGGHVLFVGDPNQLPPVGHGAPLRDMIEAGLPCAELKEIRRNSGTIVKACAQMREGEQFDTDERIQLAPPSGVEPDEFSPKNLYLARATSSRRQIDKMVNALEAVRLDGMDPMWDAQVLAAVNRRSELSRQALNVILQDRLNPGASSPFRTGDKIVNTKNKFFPVDDRAAFEFDADETDVAEVSKNDRGEVFVANGELAKVLEVQDRLLIARLWNPNRVIKIPRGRAGDDGKGDDGKRDTSKRDTSNRDDEDAGTATGCTWDLGYAISCHKSQGSEWPVVIVMLDEYPGAKMVCSREWIYTAVSRAKKLCILVGKKATAGGYCRKQSLHLRKTFLVEFIEEWGAGPKDAPKRFLEKDNTGDMEVEKDDDDECPF